MVREDLIAYVDDALADGDRAALEAELRADPDARAGLAAALRQRVLLQHVLWTSPRRGVRRVVVVLATLGVAAAALIATLLGPTDPVLPRIGGHEVPAGTVIAGDHALTWSDDSHARLEAGRLLVLPGELTRLMLERGALHCTVAPRGGLGFAVETPHLTAAVIGTDFSVTAADDYSMVAVTAGRVAVSDAAGDRELGPGQRWWAPAIRLAPVADASFDRTDPGARTGTGDELRLGGPDHRHVAFLRYDLPDWLPAGSRLRLELPAPGLIAAPLPDAAWTEADLCYWHHPSLEQADWISTGTDDTSVTLTVPPASSSSVTIALAAGDGQIHLVPSREADGGSVLAIKPPR